MAKPKKTGKKPKVNVQDLRATKNPKGGVSSGWDLVKNKGA